MSEDSRDEHINSGTPQNLHNEGSLGGMYFTHSVYIHVEFDEPAGVSKFVRTS